MKTSLAVPYSKVKPAPGKLSLWASTISRAWYCHDGLLGAAKFLNLNLSLRFCRVRLEPVLRITLKLRRQYRCANPQWELLRVSVTR
jgi:hypothetical protein